VRAVYLVGSISGAISRVPLRASPSILEQEGLQMRGEGVPHDRLEGGIRLETLSLTKCGVVVTLSSQDGESGNLVSSVK
jgi:hypothetical protein